MMEIPQKGGKMAAQEDKENGWTKMGAGDGGENQA